MVKIEGLENRSVQPYEIQFTVGVGEIDEHSYEIYQPFDAVTRRNFTSLSIRSFLESRGKLNVQSTFCSLASEHTNFDMISTLQNLLHQQRNEPIGYFRLSPYERQMIHKAYRGLVGVPTDSLRIARHLESKRVIHVNYTENKIGQLFNDQLSGLLSSLIRDKPVFRISASMSYKEFTIQRDWLLYGKRRKK